MPGLSTNTSYICKCCLERQISRIRPNVHPKTSRPLFTVSIARQDVELPPTDKDGRSGTPIRDKKEKGAMSRRLEEMAYEGLEASGTRADKYIAESGFSEDLKRKLEARIADSQFKSDNAASISVANMPSSAGKGTRDIAAAKPWTGTESLGDAALRMLDDAHKPLPKSQRSRSSPSTRPIDFRLKRSPQASPGQRLANARDRTSIYATSQDETMTEKEKQEMRRILKERFEPGSRTMPATIQGLQSVASQRIEDAIARGQFRNIPRGKGVNTERDYNANSPFIDTTEYFMNKIIQKQELTPPWIEKQGELTRAVTQFRSRLRTDWKRHAARVIASKGGTLEAQVERARRYAAAEAIVNPKKVQTETITAINKSGELSQITVRETPPNAGLDNETKITVTESAPTSSTTTSSSPPSTETASDSPTTTTPPSNQPLIPFRDQTWLTAELSYHNLSIRNLNDLTRSYNLMAPELAKKPYFNLQRELNSCFADIAPELPGEIEYRAKMPERIRIQVIGHKSGGVLEKFGAGERARVYDDTKPSYGFKEFWRDLWGDKGGAGREKTV